MAAQPEPVVAGTAASKPTAAKPTNRPMVRTMVEAIPGLTDGEEGLGDILMDDLHDIFTAVTYTNARTKALLKSREPVDIREQAKELQDYAESIGASPSSS
ncbi:MAG: hypothetical protein CL902_09020 [Dehalococcoidia bacterium]|nr:hypothetical protein [Dehalococcoidia bacterium]